MFNLFKSSSVRKIQKALKNPTPILTTKKMIIKAGDFVVPNAGQFLGHICKVVACFPSISEIAVECHTGDVARIAVDDLLLH